MQWGQGRHVVQLAGRMAAAWGDVPDREAEWLRHGQSPPLCTQGGWPGLARRPLPCWGWGLGRAVYDEWLTSSIWTKSQTNSQRTGWHVFAGGGDALVVHRLAPLSTAWRGD